jgi:hypothetical protein
MDCVILLQFGGSLNEQFELVGMRPHMLTFKNPLSFNELVARVRAVMNTGCDMCLHGRYNMGDNKPIYMMLPLGFEDEWQLYKSCASQSRLKGVEVVSHPVPSNEPEASVRVPRMFNSHVQRTI